MKKLLLISIAIVSLGQINAGDDYRDCMARNQTVPAYLRINCGANSFCPKSSLNAAC